MLKSIRPEKIRAVLFDLDGTLIDSEAAWYAACNETMRDYGMPIVAWDVFEREFIGVAVRKNIDRTFPGFSEDEKDIIEVKYKQGFVRNLGLVNLKEWANQVLSLVKKKGFRCALVTNAPRQIVEKITQNFRIDSYFEVTVCEGEAERAKPSPDPVVKACSLIGVNPSEAVFVEDSVAGIMAGKSAGCYTVAIGDLGSSKRLIDAGAREVFDGLNGLYEFIDRIS
jgi:phosphoglycolate phosphatase